MRRLPVVVLLCASLVLVALPITPARSRPRQDDTYDCYQIDAGNICAAIHYENGAQQYADFYVSSDDGFAMATWQTGIGVQITYMETIKDGNALTDPGGGTAYFRPNPTPFSPPDSPECRACIDLQTRLCYDIWRAEDQDAASTTAGTAFLCLGLAAVTPAMLICLGGSMLNGLSKRRAADARLNACLINGYRTCFDPQGRSCWP